MDVVSQLKRPKRLWVAAILNIVVATLALALLIFLLTSARVPHEVRPSPLDAALGGIPALLLVYYSAFALKGQSSARRALLGVATLFYGLIILQNALPLLGISETIVPSQKLFANVVRNCISLGINWWALSGAKTRLFFDAHALPPNTSLERTRER